MKQKNILIFCILFLNSCQRDLTEHERFMNECECFIYNYEVITEELNEYSVEYIDPEATSECVKTQLRNTYLLVLSDENYISVYNEHPQKNLALIEQCIRRYKKDSSRLSSFVKWENTLSLTLSKKYSDPEKKNLPPKYHEWKYVFLSKKNGNWVQDSTKNTDLWPWGNAK